MMVSVAPWTLGASADPVRTSGVAYVRDHAAPAGATIASGSGDVNAALSEGDRGVARCGAAGAGARDRDAPPRGPC